jgi:hypothetical protein
MTLINPQSWDFLTSFTFGSSLQTSGAISFDARDELWVVSRVTGYSGSDIASFRFNGDTSTNYWSRSISFAAASTTATNAEFASATLARLHPTATTLQRSSSHLISNIATKSKVGTIQAQTGSGSAATIPVIEFGGFEWVNTSAQITSITMLTAGGSITMAAGTGFAVFGRNL